MPNAEVFLSCNTGAHVTLVHVCVVGTKMDTSVCPWGVGRDIGSCCPWERWMGSFVFAQVDGLLFRKARSTFCVSIIPFNPTRKERA